MSAQGVLHEIAKAFGDTELQLGDPKFDKAALLAGDPIRLRALLDHDARRALRRALATTTLTGGELRYEAPGRDGDVGVKIDALIELAKLLRGDRASTATRLERIARADPVSAVRLGALKSLYELAPTHAQQVAGGLLGSTDAVVVTEAALLVGDRVRLAWAAAQASVDDATRGRALEQLAAKEDSFADAGLLAALASERASLMIAALRHLSGRARSTLEGRSSEEVVLPLLEAGDAGVRLAAARALGRVGTVAAVEPLMALRDRGVIASLESTAARQSIAEIQGRAGGAGAGALSLASSSGAGALSEAPSTSAGALSSSRRQRSS